MATLELNFESGESSLSVRRFAVHEALSTPFSVSVWARSPDATLDLDSLVGQSASLWVDTGYAYTKGNRRGWSGIVRYMEMARGEASDKGLSTYYLLIVPKLWLLTQRTNYRVYQHLKIPDIVDKLLGEWSIKPAWQIDRGKYPELEYRVQYGETDFAFLNRLLEEAGITLFFDDTGGSEAILTLGDAPHSHEKRSGSPIPYVDNPTQAAEREFVTRVHMSHEVRPGAHVIRDVDFRRPAFALMGEAPKAGSAEDRYEQFHYRPGAFRIEPGQGGDTPSADDRGIARHDEPFGHGRAGRSLLGDRMGRRTVMFDTNVIDLRPGTVFSIDGHAHPEVSGKELLVTGLSIQGSPGGEWTMTGQAVFADMAYVPPETTPRPEAYGVETATVVGPAGDEIHTDEFGRVRVQFPWDREGKLDEQSSCWIRPNQGWGGVNYGMLSLPRIGQEVLVGFVMGNPDEPVIMSRVFNQTQPVAYKLPDNKTISQHKSNSSPAAEGYNEFKYEDKAGDELLYQQAQKNLRALTKNDETSTILNDRAKSVGKNETDTTGVNRTEVTGSNRTETTGKDRMTHIVGNRDKLIKQNETEVTKGNRKKRVKHDVDVVTKQDKREGIGGGAHLEVKGKRSEKIGGTQSLIVGKDQFEQVLGSHALSAGQEIHLASGDTMIGEAADATIKGPGGFIRIDASGVTIVGTMVDINVRGTPGEGKGSAPEAPDAPEQAQIEPPG